MQPIPRGLLIHSAQLNDVERDSFGKEEDRLVAVLERVRVEPSDKIVVNEYGTDIQCSAVLFIDARSSTPAGVSVDVGQSVVWDGRRYRVQDVQRFYDNRKYHHMEVALTDG